MATKPAADPTAKFVRSNISTARSALRLKINPSQAVAAHLKLGALSQKNPNLTYAQLMARLPKNQAIQYSDLTNVVPSGSLPLPANLFRRTLAGLKSARAAQLSAQAAADKATQKAEKDAAKAASKNESFETQDETLSEALTGGNDQNPPNILVLQRRGIRIFPDGKRVVLYDNKKLGLIFTIPYTGNSVKNNDINSVTNEEIEFDEEIEIDLNEANVTKMGRIKLIRARVRGGKIQRRKKVSAVKGFTIRGGKVVRMKPIERLHRKRAAKRAKFKRKAKMARALIKRKRSLRKRASIGL